MNTIDMTPTWNAAVRIYCAVLRNPDADESAKISAEADLLELANAMDRIKARRVAQADVTLGELLDAEDCEKNKTPCERRRKSSDNCCQHYPVSDHSDTCAEYWERGLECRCIPEGVKQDILDGAKPEDVI